MGEVVPGFIDNLDFHCANSFISKAFLIDEWVKDRIACKAKFFLILVPFFLYPFFKNILLNISFSNLYTKPRKIKSNALPTYKFLLNT